MTMPAGDEVDSCNSCLLGYNNRDRSPKILSCYHTYCKACLEQYMFQDNIITCLSCSKTTPAESVSSLPDNPYLRPEIDTEMTRGRTISTNGEEVYYSDSDDDSSRQSRHNSSQMNGSAVSHVKGIEDMVLNTQRTNMQKTRSILDSSLNKVQMSLQMENNKVKVLGDCLQATEHLKNKLEKDFLDKKQNCSTLNDHQAKIQVLKMQLNSLDPMDYAKTKHLHEQATHLKNSIKAEFGAAAQHEELDQSIRNSMVKIMFEKTDDELLSKIQAEGDSIYLRMASSLEKDKAMICLTTYMLTNIFSEQISSHNPSYQERLRHAMMEDCLDAPQPLDDISEYIDFINHQMQTKAQISKTEKSPSPISNNNNNNITRANHSGTSSPDEWKVVGTKETRKETRKTSSFADMAKKPGNPTPITFNKKLPYPEKTVAQTNRPHCYFKLQVDNDPPIRVVFELRPDMAPKMADNFIKLCKGLPDGRGYKGSKIFRAKANDHILGGDFENDDGTGGHSAYEEKYFLAEQCPLKDQKGAIRMKGLERTIDGRCRVGSQFMIWVGDLEYKEYRFTLVFGRVVEGLTELQEISRIKAVQKSPTSWVLRQTVSVVESGVL